MTDNQKVIHNFIADLFMPSDTSLYDDNDGKAGNRIKQVMLQHIDAIKIMLEDSYNKCPFLQILCQQELKKL